MLALLWRLSFGVTTARQLAGIERFGLWESPCGLAFFDPMIPGDEEFYQALYRRLGESGPWTQTVPQRTNFARVASLITPHEKVLDIGCGTAHFANYIPDARYVGLDRNVAEEAAYIWNESIEDHTAAHPEEYDAVCAFHVIEHVDDPAGFVGNLIRCLRPGGRLFLAVPCWPSALTYIPNFVINGPPHHLTWWSEMALQRLAEARGLHVESIEKLTPSPASSLLYWMGLMAPKLTGERFFQDHWGWDLALLRSWLAGPSCNALFRPPARANSFEILLVARKPA